MTDRQSSIVIGDWLVWAAGRWTYRPTAVSLRCIGLVSDRRAGGGRRWGRSQCLMRWFAVSISMQIQRAPRGFAGYVIKRCGRVWRRRVAALGPRWGDARPDVCLLLDRPWHNESRVWHPTHGRSVASWRPPPRLSLFLSLSLSSLGRWSWEKIGKNVRGHVGNQRHGRPLVGLLWCVSEVTARQSTPRAFECPIQSVVDFFRLLFVFCSPWYPPPPPTWIGHSTLIQPDRSRPLPKGDQRKAKEESDWPRRARPSVGASCCAGIEQRDSSFERVDVAATDMGFALLAAGATAATAPAPAPALAAAAATAEWNSLRRDYLPASWSALTPLLSQPAQLNRLENDHYSASNRTLHPLLSHSGLLSSGSIENSIDLYVLSPSSSYWRMH